jgi:cytochrome P450
VADRQRCPVAHSSRYGGTWLPVTHSLVSEVAYDHDRFTSRSVVVAERRPGPDAPPIPIGVAPPITSDPPFHAIVRRMLIPAFAPKAIAALEPFTRSLCRELLSSVGDRASFDASVLYAQHIPVRVIVQFLGFPQSDADLFRSFIRRVMEDVDQTPDVRDEVLEEMDDYMTAQISAHREHPRDDLTSFLCDAEIGGEKLSIEHIRGTMVLLMIAGIDTSWSAIGASLWHLASHEADLRRLVSQPELMDTALLPFPAANRDPAAVIWSGGQIRGPRELPVTIS